MMHVHGRAGARLRTYLDLETTAALIARNAEKDDLFPQTVFDLARIAIHQAPTLRPCLPDLFQDSAQQWDILGGWDCWVKRPQIGVEVCQIL